MRLFFAIPLPDKVKQQLVHLRQPIEGIRWQRPEQMHLTLKFVGDVDHQKAEKLRIGVADIDHPSFIISLRGMGYFPENQQPKVVWTGIQENELLKELQQKVEHTCREIGIPPESRPYKPHITLGRVINASKQMVNSFMNQHKDFSVNDVPVTEFVLYQSKLYSEGARHLRLQTFTLSANG